MKRIVSAVAIAAFGSVLALAADAPQPNAMSKIFDQGVSGVEHDVVPLAEAMPPEKYNFAPSSRTVEHSEFKGVRTFAQQMKHIAATNYAVGAALLQQPVPAVAGTGENGPDSMTSKEQIVKFLKDSFAYVHQGIATVNERNVTDSIASPFGPGKMVRGAVAAIPAWHTMDHYGQSVEYLRMNGIIPPASR